MANSCRDERPADAGSGAAGWPEAGALPCAASRDGLRLAELLAARLCHEISGPAGTLAGAVDLARTDAHSAAEALGIAADAAASLTVRLRLLRAAWAGPGEALDAGALRRLCAGLPFHVTLDADACPPGRCFAPDLAHVLLNALLLAAESLPKGGVVMLGEAGADAAIIAPRGRDAAWPAGLAAWVADPAPAWHAAAGATPRGLQGPLTALLAHRAGVRLSFGFPTGAFAGSAGPVPPLSLRLPA